MPESKQNGGNEDYVRKGELFVLKSGIDDVKDEQAKQHVREHERREQEIDNQTAQIALNRSLVWLTGFLVILGIAGSGISVWQSVVSQKAARAAESAANAAIDAVQAARASNGTNRAGILDSNRLTTEAINQNERLTSASIEEIKKSNDVSAIAATAAVEANKLARDQFFLEQRPWLTVEIISPLGRASESTEFPDGFWSVSVGVVNAGRTPAFRASRLTKAWTIIENKGQYISAFLKQLQLKSPTPPNGDGMHFPNKAVTDTLILPPLDKPAVDRIASLATRLFVYGRIDYGDSRTGVNDERPYRTVFCRTFNPKISRWALCDGFPDEMR